MTSLPDHPDLERDNRIERVYTGDDNEPLLNVLLYILERRVARLAKEDAEDPQP